MDGVSAYSLRKWAGFNIRRPFNSRARNALIADARSVDPAAFVGEDRRWYAFGEDRGPVS